MIRVTSRVIQPSPVYKVEDCYITVKGRKEEKISVATEDNKIAVNPKKTYTIMTECTKMAVGGCLDCSQLSTKKEITKTRTRRRSIIDITETKAYKDIYVINLRLYSMIIVKQLGCKENIDGLGNCLLRKVKRKRSMSNYTQTRLCNEPLIQTLRHHNKNRRHSFDTRRSIERVSLANFKRKTSANAGRLLTPLYEEDKTCGALKTSALTIFDSVRDASSSIQNDFKEIAISEKMRIRRQSVAVFRSTNISDRSRNEHENKVDISAEYQSVDVQQNSNLRNTILQTENNKVDIFKRSQSLDNFKKRFSHLERNNLLRRQSAVDLGNLPNNAQNPDECKVDVSRDNSTLKSPPAKQLQLLHRMRMRSFENTVNAAEHFMRRISIDNTLIMSS